jgi:hypothetical protein
VSPPFDGFTFNTVRVNNGRARTSNVSSQRHSSVSGCRDYVSAHSSVIGARPTWIGKSLKNKLFFYNHERIDRSVLSQTPAPADVAKAQRLFALHRNTFFIAT